MLPVPEPSLIASPSALSPFLRGSRLLYLYESQTEKSTSAEVSSRITVQDEVVARGALNLDAYKMSDNHRLTWPFDEPDS